MKDDQASNLSDSEQGEDQGKTAEEDVEPVQKLDDAEEELDVIKDDSEC